MVQLTYGISTAADIAYFTNMYTMVEPDQFLRLTSMFHSAVLAGQATSGVLAQLLVSVGGV
jgi:thiamine transporter 2/3